MLERLPERARTPQTARAMTAPATILLAGAGASAAILAGAPLALAAAAGAALWAGRVALAVPRRPARAVGDPATLRAPWGPLVRQARRAEARFDQVVATTDAGPLRDRLAEVDARVAVGVDECWRIAQRGDELHRALAGFDLAALRDQVAEAEARAARHADRSDLAATAAALRAQLASAERLAAVAQDAEDRLRRLAAQLDEAAARAVELSLQRPDAGSLQPLGTDVEDLVGELETLRVALEETGGGGRRRPGGAARA